MKMYCAIKKKKPDEQGELYNHIFKAVFILEIRQNWTFGKMGKFGQQEDTLNMNQLKAQKPGNR